jgi:hypothetical protein
MSTKINIVGHKFGKLTPLRFSDIISGRSIYECRCDCGEIVFVKAKYLLNGDTKSCGCLKVETAISNSKISITHGLTNHPLYKVWASLKDRCLNTKCHAYKDYGGRGITVSQSWLSFENFYHDVIDGYEKGLELDRIKNNEGYSKDNFRWATSTQNKRNRRTSIYLTVNGITKHIQEWADQYSISRHSIFGRIKYDHLSGKEALFGPRLLKNKYGKEKVH